MPLADSFFVVAIADIYIDRGERDRREISTEGLKQSIEKRGLLHPIIVEAREAGGYRLIAGERRLTCYVELNREMIEVRLKNGLTPSESRLIELEENVKRLDLPWQDRVMALKRMHRLLQANDPDWTLGETAEETGISMPEISKSIRVATEIEGDLESEYRKCDSMAEAYNSIMRREQRARGDELDDLVGVLMGEVSPAVEVELPEVVANMKEGHSGPHGAPMGGGHPDAGTGNITVLRPSYGPHSPVPAPPPTILPPTDPHSAERHILHQSFLQWAPAYTGEKFNFIHCDFPYGIGVFDGQQAGGQGEQTYDDSGDIYEALMECFCAHHKRFMSLSSHLLFWYSERREDPRPRLKAAIPDMRFYTFPLIWLKTDNLGIAEDVKRMPRHIYETACFGVRGDKNIVKLVADAKGAPTDKVRHPSAKPLPVLRHFFDMLVDESTTLLDPTCGSGGALEVAEEKGAKRILGLEIDPEHVASGRKFLRQARVLRSMSGSKGK